MNLPHDNLTSSVQLLYCLGLLGTYIPQAMPAIDIIEKTQIFKNLSNPFEKYGYPYIKNIILRTLLVLFTGLLATIIPKFGLFINLTGAFACTALAFILPILMYNRVFADTITVNEKRLHWFLVIFGSMCGLISFIMSLVEIVKAFGSADSEEEMI